MRFMGWGRFLVRMAGGSLLCCRIVRRKRTVQRPAGNNAARDKACMRPAETAPLARPPTRQPKQCIALMRFHRRERANPVRAGDRESDRAERGERRRCATPSFSDFGLALSLGDASAIGDFIAAAT